MAPHLITLYTAAWQAYQDNLAALALSREPWSQSTPEAKATRDALFKLGGIEAMCLESGITSFEMTNAVIAHMNATKSKDNQ